MDVSTPNRVLSIKAENVCGIDFSNARLFGENGDWSAHLKNGKFERKSESGYESARLDHVFRFNKKSGAKYALVMTNWTDCGGSCMSTGVVQLFAVRAAHPLITQQFVFDSLANGNRRDI